MTSRAQRRTRRRTAHRVHVLNPDARATALRRRLSANGVPADTALRRIRLAHAALVSAAASGIAIPVLLARLGDINAHAAEGWGAVVGMVTTMLLYGAHTAWSSVLHGPGAGMASGRTLTGLRTVDLTDLSRIRRLRCPSRFGGWVDELWITDGRGVFLFTDDPEVIARIAALVAGGLTKARVSRHAAARLGMAATVRGRWLVDFLVAVWTPLAAGVFGAFVCRWLSTV